jgi:YD repeat-containing protein
MIDFNYNYSLCPGTTNSSPDVEKGKLTLYSINARGKGGVYTVPPTVFDYELSTLEQKNGSIVTNAAGIISSAVALTEGDLLVLNNATNQFLGVVTISPTGDMVLKGGSAVPNTVYNFRTTKNPPYDKDYYDAWGLYKPDLIQPLLAANENLARKTSKASANATDVWSLRKIKTSLGAEIKVTYESDAYGKIGIPNANTAIITSFSYDDVNDLLTLSIQDDYNLLPLSQMFVVGEKLDFIAEQYVAARLPNCQFTTVKYIRDTRSFGGLEIHSVNQGNKTITVKLPGLFLPGDPWFGNSGCGPGNYGPYIAGNLFLKDINNIGYGSGLRVKSLAINSPSFSNYTYYKYEAVGNPGVSSGITSFEPNILDISAFNDNTDDTKAYKKVLYANINYLLTISRIVPPPGVMYEYVTIENKVKNSDESNERSVEGKTEYQFEVFDPKMIDRKKISSSANGAEYAVNLSFRNSTASIGNLKRATKYDNLGKKLSESVLHHLHDDIAGSTTDDFYATYNTKLDQFNKQGLIMQRYSEVKEVKQNNSSAFDVKATLSSWEEFPNVTTGQTNTNYVTGASATTSNLGFDFYSGSVTKKLNVDPYGNRFITEVIPAYQKYPKMGLKVNDITNKNMLSQETSVRIYKVDANNNNLGLVSASVDTWSNGVGVIDKNGNSWVQNNASTVGDVWRKQSTYGWSPEGKTLNGLTALGSFSDFNWSTPSSVSADWKKMSEVTLYEVSSKTLEVKDINDKYGATKLGYNNSLVLMTASNSRYNEIAFSGAEDDLINGKFGGNVAPGNGVVLDAASVAPSLIHTGRKSLKVSGSQSGFSFTTGLDDSKQYLASVWVKSEDGNIPSGAQIYVSRFGLSPISASVTSKVANGWYLIQIIVPGYSDNATTVSCKNTGGANLIFDDFRFQPINALSSAYVYDPFSGELTYILDGNNLYTRYEYDAAGRLVRTYREKLGIGEFKTNEYQYNLGGAF